MKQIMNNTVVGWAAIVVGLVSAITPAWASPSPAAAGFTLGMGAMAVLYGVWSLIAHDPTRDHWALSVVGLILGISPWLAMFADERAAWAAWVCGLLLASISGAAYVRDEGDDATETERVRTMATYMAEHPRDTAAAERLSPTPPEDPHSRHRHTP